MATSFISEHSAEFSLVPALKEILERKFEYVVPLYPWVNRETSSISKSLHKNAEFFILVMFSRRPKIASNMETSISITMNHELEEIQKLGELKGIPAIAGCPHAIDFWELAKSKKHIWLSIGHQMTSDYLIPIASLNNSEDTPILTDDKILGLVDDVCKKQNILSFKEFLIEVRWKLPHTFFGPRYKPVYFLMDNH